MEIQRKLQIYVQIFKGIWTSRCCGTMTWVGKTRLLKDLFYLLESHLLFSLPKTPLKDSKGWCLVTLRVTISEITNSCAHFLCFTFSLSQLLRSGRSRNDSPWYHHWMEGRCPLPVQWHWTGPLFCGTSPSLPTLFCGGHIALFRDPWRSLHAQSHCAELPPYKHAGEHLSELSMTRGKESQ